MTLPTDSARGLAELADAAPQPDFMIGSLIACLIVSFLFVTALVALAVWLVRRRRRPHA